MMVLMLKGVSSRSSIDPFCARFFRNDTNLAIHIFLTYIAYYT